MLYRMLEIPLTDVLTIWAVVDGSHVSVLSLLVEQIAFGCCHLILSRNLLCFVEQVGEGNCPFSSERSRIASNKSS